MPKWRKIRALDRLEWQVILSSLVALPWCAVLLRLRGFQKARTTFLADELAAQACPPTRGDIDRARRIARAVDLAALYGPYHANCLKRSLVLCRELHKRKLPCQLKLGASKVERDFSAHAWVELGGHVVNDHPGIASRFAVLDSLDNKGC